MDAEPFCLLNRRLIAIMSLLCPDATCAIHLFAARVLGLCEPLVTDLRQCESSISSEVNGFLL